MKKNLFYLFALLCSVSLFTACSDDDDTPKFPKDEVNATYKSTDASNQLQLLYSGEPMLGKSATFNTTDGKTATIVLEGVAVSLTKMPAASSAGSGVIPGEATTTLNVNLEPVGETGYTFKGTDETNGRTVAYEGAVEKGKLTLQLNVTMPNNNLIGTWNLYPYDSTPTNTVHPLRLTWESSKKFQLDLFGMGMITEMHPGELMTFMSAIGLLNDGDMNLQEAISSLLKDVTFKADGNIQASYSEAANLGNPVWKKSPLNIAQYYVKDGKIYLLLNVDAILATVAGNKSTRMDITTILPQLMQLLPMVYSGIPLGYSISENGTLGVYIEKELGMQLINMFLPLLQNEEVLAEIMESVNSNPAFAAFAGVTQAIFEQLPTVAAGTTKMELGLNFVKPE
ncbi:DUF4925 domain-containing protein [Bacteroides sp. GD17]|jgi:hypothetical protein|uniref:DUF4925 domain-containing protein n=1 Tax=Bacteroides sp. GD17 TaxID=3139826 RepID=UPI0025E9904D|nr:DUF4925 domain-containing protein [uncultured Bacteroides sp.]